MYNGNHNDICNNDSNNNDNSKSELDLSLSNVKSDDWSG